MLRELDSSLKQLRRDRVDLYLVHEPDQFELTDDLKEVFAGLKLNGMVGAFGLAWGRVADAGTGFGTVAQGRHAANLPAYGIEGETRILHGALRHDWHGKLGAAGIRIRQVLDAHPDAAVVFSASAPNQIHSITRQLL